MKNIAFTRGNFKMKISASNQHIEMTWLHSLSLSSDELTVKLKRELSFQWLFLKNVLFDVSGEKTEDFYWNRYFYWNFDFD